MKLVVNLLFVIMVNQIIAQSYNLVPNYSFETYTNCPTSSNQLSYASSWVNPTQWGTPDYFNSCSPTFGVPSYCNCSSIFQYAKSGNAYCGFWGFNFGTLTREYIQTQLNTSLTAGKCYKINFYINLSNPCGIACNNIALYLSSNAINATGSNILLNYTPQIKKFNNEIVYDTLNWVLISGIYTSIGGENFITIGNFNDDNTTDTITVNSASGYGVYYNIDDVSVLPIDSIPGGMPANAGSDKNIAIGDSTFIGYEITNLNCNWFILGGSQIATNKSGIYVKPTAPTTYVVEQNLCGTITYDTVKVWVSPTGINEYDKLQNSVSIFPNPNNGNVSLQFTDITKGNVDVIISDVTGKIVYDSKLQISNSLTNFTIDVKGGVYFVKIYDSGLNKTLIKKLVVQQ